MNEEASSEYSSQRAEVNIEEVDLSDGRSPWWARGWRSLHIIRSIRESIECVRKNKEQNHEHEEDAECIDFNEESEVTFQKDEEEYNWDAYAHIGQRELIEGDWMDISLRIRLLSKIYDSLNARIESLSEQLIVS